MARSQVHRAVVRGSGYVRVLKQREINMPLKVGVYQERSTCIFGAVVVLPH